MSKTPDLKKLKDFSTDDLKQEIAKRAATENLANKISAIVAKVDFTNADETRAFAVFIENQISKYWESQKQHCLEIVEKQKRENAEKRKAYKEKKQIDGQRGPGVSPGAVRHEDRDKPA